MADDTRLVLVDIDNTVYDYAPCHDAGLAAAQKLWPAPDTFRAEYDAARSAVQKEIGGTAASHSRFLYFKGMLERQNRGGALAPALALEDVYWRGYFSALRADPQCRPTLEKLRARGVSLAWVSNFTARLQGEKLVALGLDGLAMLHASEETGHEKPHRSLFDRALKAAGVPAAAALMIGDDRASDVEAARALGLRALWLDREGRGDARSWAELDARLNPAARSGPK